MARPTKAQQAAIAERRATAIRLRIAGVEPLAIAKKLAADPTINTDGLAYPMGYGIEKYEKGENPPSDRKLIVRVCQDLQIAMEARRAQLDLAVADLRMIENERLDQYQLAVHARAIGRPGEGPDLDAMNAALKIMDRRARLNGLDAPQEHTGPGGNPIVIEIDPALLPPRMDENQPEVK